MAEISSARRALRVLKILKGHTLTGLANKEISEALCESPVNVSRALDALQEEGLVTKLDNGRFSHGIALLQIANAHANHTLAIQNRLMEINRRIISGATD